MEWKRRKHTLVKRQVCLYLEHEHVEALKARGDNVSAVVGRLLLAHLSTSGATPIGQLRPEKFKQTKLDNAVADLKAKAAIAKAEAKRIMDLWPWIEYAIEHEPVKWRDDQLGRTRWYADAAARTGISQKELEEIVAAEIKRRSKEEAEYARKRAEIVPAKRGSKPKVRRGRRGKK